MTFGDHSAGIDPMVALALINTNLVSESNQVDVNLKPTDKQYALEPGDKVLLASAGAALDRQMIIGEILDPSHYAAQFPDWEERLQGLHTGAVLLLRWRSEKDPTEQLGWFGRVRMMHVTEEQFTELNRWVDEDVPDDKPEWLAALHREYGKDLAERSPDVIPMPTECGKCGSDNVVLTVEHNVEFSARAGNLPRDGEVRIVPMSDEEHNCTATAWLRCADCLARRNLDRDEMAFPANSELARLMGH